MISLKTVILFSIVLFLQCELSNSLKILGVFPYTGKSHFVMFRKLMEELAVKNHRVDVVSMFPLEKPMRNYRDIDIRADGGQMYFNNVNYTGAMQLRRLSMPRIVQMTGIGPCDSLGNPNMQKVLKTKKGVYDVIIVQVSHLSCADLIDR